MSGPGLLLLSVAALDSDDYATATKTLKALSLTANTHADLPGGWVIEVGAVKIGERGASVVVEIWQHGLLVTMLVVAERAQAPLEHQAPFFAKFDRTEKYPLFVIGIDFASDDGGGGIEAAAA